MRLLEAAGLPPGVINLVTGSGQAVSRVARAAPGPGRHPLHRLHRHVPAPVADRRREHRRATGATRALVGETGGKDFVIAHPSADPAGLTTALVRGAFEYQGQKCSAASRGYIPRSLWNRVRDGLVGGIESLTIGRRQRRPVSLHGRGHRRPGLRQALRRHRARPDPARGQRADRRRHRRQPGLLRPAHRAGVAPTRPTRSSPPSTSARSSACTSTRTPTTTPCWPRRRTSRRYALTGSIFAQDRAAIAAATEALRFSAGQLLHQRQADRGRRRPAAVRRRAGQRHQRQGRLDLQPDPLGERPDHQGAVRPADRLPLSPYGLTWPLLRRVRSR